MVPLTLFGSFAKICNTITNSNGNKQECVNFTLTLNISQK